MKKLIFKLMDTIIVIFSLLLLLFNAERIVWTLQGNKIYADGNEKKNSVFRTVEFVEFTEFPIEYSDENMRFCIGKLTNGKKVVIMYTEDTESRLIINARIKGMFIRDKGINEFFKSQTEELELSGILPEELAEYSFMLNDNPYHISFWNYVLCGISVMGLLCVIFKKFIITAMKKKRNSE